MFIQDNHSQVGQLGYLEFCWKTYFFWRSGPNYEAILDSESKAYSYISSVYDPLILVNCYQCELPT